MSIDPNIDVWTSLRALWGCRMGQATLRKAQEYSRPSTFVRTNKHILLFVRSFLASITLSPIIYAVQLGPCIIGPSLRHGDQLLQTKVRKR